MLQTVKIPAGYKKVIHGRIHDAPGCLPMMLFTPSLRLSDVRLADRVIEREEEEFATLIIDKLRN